MTMLIKDKSYYVLIKVSNLGQIIRIDKVFLGPVAYYILQRIPYYELFVLPYIIVWQSLFAWYGCPKSLGL